jgi:hypothetical protein
VLSGKDFSSRHLQRVCERASPRRREGTRERGSDGLGHTPVQTTLTNVAFASTRQSLSTSLRALQTTPASTSTSVPPLVPGLPDAFAQLLTTFRHTVTGLSLAFKPPITVPAAIAQLDKLSDQLGRIISCVIAASAGEAWDLSSLVEEWRDGVLTIAGEVDKYLDALEDGGRTDAGPSDNPYLLHTGMVWDSIDKLDKELSRTEVQAVAKRWEGQKEVVKDAWNEFKEFLEDAGGKDGEAEAEGNEARLDLDDDDDEWGELERAMAGGEMTAEEKARAEAVRGITTFTADTTGQAPARTAPNPARDCTSLPVVTFTGDVIPAIAPGVFRVSRRFRHRHRVHVPRARRKGDRGRPVRP